MEVAEMPAEFTKNDTLERKEAFEYYYSLGEERSLQKTAEFTGKGFATIKRWSRSLNWTERVKQRDLELASKLEKKTNHTILTSKVEYRGAIRSLVEKFKEDVANGDIKIKSVQDFEKIVRLDMDLMGVDMGEDDGNMQSLAEILKASAGLIQSASGGDIGGARTNE
jgi:hypothetical protein